MDNPKSADPVRRFELRVMRPLQLVLIGTAVFNLVRGEWWLLGGAVVGSFYLGVIGSGLHPLQTAMDLMQGTVEGPAAVREAETLSLRQKQGLVVRATRRVGIGFGFATFGVLLYTLGWKWYASLLVAWVSMILSSVLLRIMV